MGKKRSREEPKLWKLAKNIYLCPEPDGNVSQCYAEWKARFSDITIVFLKNWSTENALTVLTTPNGWKERNGYYILENRLAILTQIDWVGKRFSIINDKVMYLGSEVCDQCFREGQLYPMTCPKHLACSHKKIIESCFACVAKTFAGYWKDRISALMLSPNINPLAIRRGSHAKHDFICPSCPHSFSQSIANITLLSRWCIYCANQRLCEKNNCVVCINKSFAQHPRAAYWHAIKNTLSPRMVFIKSPLKYWFTCDACGHDFKNSPNMIVILSRWCPYCAHQKRCDSDCKICFRNSFASHPKAQFWHVNKNSVTPYMVAIQSPKLYWFTCGVCEHDFETSPNQIGPKNRWCPFCVNRQRCDDNCEKCFKNSFASHNRSVQWHPTKNNINPRLVALHSNKKYWFICETCNHDFESSPDGIVAYDRWCPYCAHLKRCENGTCSICALNCEACLTRKAFFVAKQSRRNYCKPCLQDAIFRDPSETPLQVRAKITLEIYTLAELQRTSHFLHFLAQEPTSWDCSILPSLGFKPDIMWCWNNDDICFQTAGACKLNENEIAYTLILEVVEESRKTHSASRSIPDAEREKQIRELFVGKAIGFCYVTMAHTKHKYAHPEDVFFAKNEIEYYVPDSRLEAWQERIDDVRDKLNEMHNTKSCDTVFIGY